VVKALVKSLRPHQWFKNLFVVAPLAFSKHLFEPEYVALSALAFGIFSLLSGSVYLVNDIFDIEKDRAHPVKRKRPIPSGALPLGAARTAAALLIVFALGAALASFGVPFFAVAASYLLLNLAYSMAFKHIPFLDVISIAGGFLLRVVAGALALSVPASPWLLICTFVLAAFLGFGKRTHELATAGEKAKKQRAVLSKYNLRHLKIILWVLALATTVAYLLYTISPQTVSFFGTNRLIYTTPFVLFGVIRFLRLISKSTTADSPTDEMLHDIPFMANLALCAGAVIAIIYFL